MSVDLTKERMVRGDVLAICSIAQRVYADDDVSESIVGQAERAFVGRLLIVLWSTVDEDRQSELRALLAERDDESARFAYGGGLDACLRESRTRLWLTAQTPTTIAGVLGMLAGDPPQLPEPGRRE